MILLQKCAGLTMDWASPTDPLPAWPCTTGHTSLDGFDKLFFSILSRLLILFPAMSKLFNKPQITFIRVYLGEKATLVQRGPVLAS